MQQQPISLVVITHDEAANIARCLDSVPFAAEKLVVDSGSTDATVAIAQAHGARVLHQDWLGFGAQRNFASMQASHDWIIVLDADEYLPDALVAECGRRLQQLLASSHAAAWLRRTTDYMGAPMRWYRPMVGERMARIYHRRRARWSDVRVHESLQFDGTAAEFEAPFNHLHNPTLVHKQLKVLRYVELKAQDWKEKQRTPRLWTVPLVFLVTFFKDYVLRLACLDGGRGFVVAQTAAQYAVYKRLRYYELLRNPDSLEQAHRELVRHDLEHE